MHTPKDDWDLLSSPERFQQIVREGISKIREEIGEDQVSDDVLVEAFTAGFWTGIDTTTDWIKAEKKRKAEARRSKKGLDKQGIKIVLKQEGGNVSAAARRLDMSRKQLSRILKEFEE